MTTSSDSIEITNINGVITPTALAAIPVTDHGFLYGDNVYETLRTYERIPFLVRRHLARLRHSASGIRLALAWSDTGIAHEITRTVRGAPGSHECAIRVIVTRGSGPFGYDPDLCPNPNLIIMVRPLPPVTPRESLTGISAAVVEVRRNPVESLDPRIKSGNLLNNILAAQQAKEAGVEEAILFNTAGHLAEGTTSNVFFVADSRLLTPALACGILSGLTREVIIEMAAKAGVPVEQGSYAREELERADEIFLSSTTREILPVASLNGRPVGAGRRGPMTARLQEMFRDEVARLLRADAPDLTA